MHFTIEGEFITNLAREKFFVDKDMAGAIKLLRSCLMSDQITSDEQLILCLQILHGAASIKGNSENDDYGVEYRDDIEKCPTNLSAISQLITDMNEEIKSLREQNRNMADKIVFLSHELSDSQLERINADYYNTNEEPLFTDIPVPKWRILEKSERINMLESYLAQRRHEDKEQTCDYGWLAPDGTFYPVEWGWHSSWADEWLEEHMPYNQHPEIYKYTDPQGVSHHLSSVDVMTYSLGWILLHNPYQGLANITKSPYHNMTKEQKEFLYDYFTERGRTKEANELYNE